MKTLYKKLFELRQEVKPMVKDTEGYNYKYFDINQIVAQIQPLLKKHGLMLLQPLTELNGEPALKTTLVEVESGEELSTTQPLIKLLDPQKMGAVITYFRRYALQSLLFLEAEDDDAISIKSPLAGANKKPSKTFGVDHGKVSDPNNYPDKPF